MQNKMVIVCMLSVTIAVHAGIQEAVNKIDEALKYAKSDKVIKLLTSAKQDLVAELKKAQSPTTTVSQTSVSESGDEKALADKISKSISWAMEEWTKTVVAYRSNKYGDMNEALNATLDNLLSALNDYANLKKIVPGFRQDTFDLLYKIKRVHDMINNETIFWGNDLQLDKTKAWTKMKQIGELIKS